MSYRFSCLFCMFRRRRGFRLYIYDRIVRTLQLNWYSNRENYNPVLSIVDVMKYISISLSIFKPDIKQHPVFVGVEQFPFVISRY